MSEYIHIMHKYTLVDIWKCTSMQMQQSKFVLGQMKSPATETHPGRISSDVICVLHALLVLLRETVALLCLASMQSTRTQSEK